MAEKEKIEELDIYTSLEDAKKEIWRRWNDKELRKKVEDFLGGDIPEPFRKEPRAVLFREPMTPDGELAYFLKLSKTLKLKPLGWEYLDDKFTTRNEDKVCLGKMHFSRGLDKNGNPIVYYKKIIDLPDSENKKFKEIKTLWGENFIDFHHRILNENFGKIELFDASKWLKLKGGKALKYYVNYLSIFICGGILFENFVINEDTMDFYQKIVRPALDKLFKKFGIKPLIIKLMPPGRNNNDSWWFYSSSIEKSI